MSLVGNGMWLDSEPLILASASETRAQLLRKAGIPVKCQPANIDERRVAVALEHAKAPPQKIARHLAIAKARAVAASCSGRVVLGADQVLIGPVGQLHKPKTRQDAAHQLAGLSGKTHRLISAFALVRDSKLLRVGHAHADLTMRPLSDTMIELYLDAAGEAVFSSVGGYQLERLGIHLFEGVRGEHSTILGLPLLSTLAALRQLRLVAA
jgi:septum formation protein